MTTEMVVLSNFDSTIQLKTICEQSLAMLQEGKDASRGSVRRDFLPLHMDEANLRKLALNNAAKALATLWKVPETRRTSLRNRTVRSQE